MESIPDQLSTGAYTITRNIRHTGQKADGIRATVQNLRAKRGRWNRVEHARGHEGNRVL